ncbi:MAG: 16S rRNA (uracil(1498)-N(3))-methyltransferase [Acidobacteria bacterium]|nr:16S rRNA (uracil(1498)-N(3))-methyltransferase [Acidobacteriota bacterium]
MARRRFYVPPESITGPSAVLPEEQAHHLRDVLRLGAGETVEIFDGTGRGWAGEVTFGGFRVLVCGLRPLAAQESGVPVILAAALIKPARFEWMIEKATELGVGEVLPLKTRFGDVRIPGDKIGDRLGRWDRIAREASRQCGRMDAPRIHPPIDFDRLLDSDGVRGRGCVLFHEKAAEVWNPDPALPAAGVLLCVGPEGGWADRETEAARAAGFEVRGLGTRILRAETAAVAALAILQHRISGAGGDVSGPRGPLTSAGKS